MTASPGSHEPEQEPPTAEETNTAQAPRAIHEETTDEATLTTEQRGVLRNNENSDTNSSASGNTNGGTIRVYRTANITSLEDDPLEYLGRDHRNYHIIKFPGHGRPHGRQTCITDNVDLQANMHKSGGQKTLHMDIGFVLEACSSVFNLQGRPFRSQLVAQAVVTSILPLNKHGS